MKMNRLESTQDLKAALFDYGEVLCHPPTDAEKAKLGSFFNIDKEPASRALGAAAWALMTVVILHSVYWSMPAKDVVCGSCG